MTNFHRHTLSSPSSSSVAGEARSLPRPRLEGDPQEASAAHDPAAAMLSLPACSHFRPPSGGHSRGVDQGGRGYTSAQGHVLFQLPTGGGGHEVPRGDSNQGSDDEESVLPPLRINDDDDDDGSGELQLVINDTFNVAQQVGQSRRVVGGDWHNMMSAALNAVDVMDYNPNVPVDPEYSSRNCAAYQRALEQYEQVQRNDVAPSSVPVPGTSNIAAAPGVAVLAAPGQDHGNGHSQDQQLAIGTNFSNSLEGMHALSQLLLEAKLEGWLNTLAHGKRKEWISVNKDKWFDRSLQGVLSNFKKVAAKELQSKIRRAETEAQARLAPGAHAEDELGSIVEDYLPQYVTLFGEYFDWKESLSRSAIDSRARQE